MWGYYRFGGREQGLLRGCTSLLVIMKQGSAVRSARETKVLRRRDTGDFGDRRNVCSSEVAGVSFGTCSAGPFSLRGVPSILLSSPLPHLHTPAHWCLCPPWKLAQRDEGGRWRGTSHPQHRKSSGSPGQRRGSCSWICPGRVGSRLAKFRRPLGSIVLLRLGRRSWALLPAWERKRGRCEPARRMETLSVVHRF